MDGGGRAGFHDRATAPERPEGDGGHLRGRRRRGEPGGRLLQRAEALGERLLRGEEVRALERLDALPRHRQHELALLVVEPADRVEEERQDAPLLRLGDEARERRLDGDSRVDC